MKRFYILIFCVLMIGWPSAGVFGAGAGFVFSEKYLAISAGKDYGIDVFADAGSARSYVAKLSLDFPANLLEAKSFDFAEGWVAVGVSPYDAVDNKNGVLIKSAGYPGGFSGKLKLGTVNFHAKRGGYGKITVMPESLAYNESAKNILSDYTSVLTLGGTGAVAAAKPKPAVKPPAEAPKPAVPAPVAIPEKVSGPKELIPPARPYIRAKLAVEPLPTPEATVEISDYEKYLSETELNELILANKNQTQSLQDKINQAKNGLATPLYALVGSLIIIFIGVIVAGIGGRRREA
jgi:hypothetical protein